MGHLLIFASISGSFRRAKLVSCLKITPSVKNINVSKSSESHNNDAQGKAAGNGDSMYVRGS